MSPSTMIFEEEGMAGQRFRKSRGAGQGGTAPFKQAQDLEEAARGINQINQRRRREKADDSAAERLKMERSKITLSPVLDEWLKK